MKYLPLITAVVSAIIIGKLPTHVSKVEDFLHEAHSSSYNSWNNCLQRKKGSLHIFKPGETVNVGIYYNAQKSKVFLYLKTSYQASSYI